MKKIFINLRYLYNRFTYFCSIVYAMVSFILIFFSVKDDLGIDSIGKKIMVILLPAILSLLIAVIIVCSKKKRIIISDSQRNIVVRYGDLWKFAFPKKHTEEKIVIVNVDTSFETIVDGPNIPNPLVNSQTIHGQWLTRMDDLGKDAATLNGEIQDNLQSRGIVPIKTVNKERGNSKIFERGTIAINSYEKTTFYLLALSEFDVHNNAQNDPEALRSTLIKLIEFLGNYSQGVDIYMPIMGSGNSRTGIDDQTALDVLISVLKLYKNKIRGNINIVVYEKSRDKVSIFE